METDEQKCEKRKAELHAWIEDNITPACVGYVLASFRPVGQHEETDILETQFHAELADALPSNVVGEVIKKALIEREKEQTRILKNMEGGVRPEGNAAEFFNKYGVPK